MAMAARSSLEIARASEVMLRTAVVFLRDNTRPREIVFCLYDREAAAAVFEKTLASIVGDTG
jgi:hypothetical protein